MDKTTFFKDLKIIELANVLAGPAVGLFFAELGARVTKIENPLTKGDVTRSWKLPTENQSSPTSAYYASVNWNKTTLFIDLTSEVGKQKIYELIKDADIVISNYKPGDDTKLRMDYATLKKINPQLIYGHITGYGTTNSRTAYDLILQAETGFMYMNGNATSGPLKMPVALIDILAAHQLKEGILLALIKKLKTKTGSFVTVSLEQAAVASLANQASNWLMCSYNHPPSGSLHPNIAPYGELFKTADDKQIVLAIGNDKQFKKLCELLDRASLATDVRFVNNAQRIIHRTDLFECIQAAIRLLDAKPFLENCIQHDVPAGIIKSVKEVFEKKQLSSLILEDKNENNESNKRVRTSVFELFD